MARATNAPASRERRKKVVDLARGYRGRRSKLFRYAKEAVQHAWQYAYIDRKKKKSDRRGLWIVRLNAACRANGIAVATQRVDHLFQCWHFRWISAEERIAIDRTPILALAVNLADLLNAAANLNA